MLLAKVAMEKGSKSQPWTEEELRQASRALASLSPACLRSLQSHVQEVENPDEIEADTLILHWSESGPECSNEAAWLGLAQLSPEPERSSCRRAVLSRKQLQLVLNDFPEESKIFARLTREAAFFLEPKWTWHENLQEASGQRLNAFLQAGREFQGCSPDFVRSLLSRCSVQGMLLAPGELLKHQQWCIVLAGRLQLESNDGIMLRFAGPGEVLTPKGLTWRAIRGSSGPAFCLQLSSPDLDASHDQDLERWQRNVEQLHSEDSIALEQRRSWVQQVAMPALASTQLLAGCPEDFLRILSGQLSEETFHEQEEIVGCNTEGKSMLVLLEGLVELRSKSGKQVGCIGPGAILGEPEALGLLSFRTATATAVTDCRLMPVSFQVLTEALEHPETPQALKEGFKELVEGRRLQVQQHQPLAGLMHWNEKWDEDVGANLLALRAERLPLECGDTWQPSSDSEASGPRLSLILRGRVEVKITTSGPPVEFHVRTGSIVPEGMLAAHGAVLRAVSTDCEVYRLWHFDLLQAAFITSQAPDWFYQLRVLEEETRGYLQSRLTNARGLVQGRWRHPADAAIRGWAEKKRENLRKAQKRQEQFYENYLGPKLPLLPPKRLGTTAFRSWGDLPKPSSAKPKGPKVGPSPSAFRALKLHRGTRSEPQLVRR